MFHAADAIQAAAQAVLDDLDGEPPVEPDERRVRRQLRDRLALFTSRHSSALAAWTAVRSSPRRHAAVLIGLISDLVEEDPVARHLVADFTSPVEPPVTLHYLDFVLSMEMNGPMACARLLEAPGGGYSARTVDLSNLEGRAADLRVCSGLPGGSRDMRLRKQAELEVTTPAQVGVELFESLFAGPVRDAWLAARGLLAGRGDLGLRLRLVFDPRQSATRLLASLPWELLRDPETETVLCLDPRTPLVRSLGIVRGLIETPPHPRRILMVRSEPITSARLDLGSETRAIEDAWRSVPGLVSASMPANLERLRKMVIEQRAEILHFMGHGDVDEKTQQGLLELEDSSRAVRRIPARALVDQLSGLELALVVLNSCSSGAMPEWTGTNTFSGVAAAFIHGGIPAVLAMQAKVSDLAAIAFSRRLYHQLAAGDTLEGAVTAGRLEVAEKGPASVEWATPVLYLARRKPRTAELRRAGPGVSSRRRGAGGPGRSARGRRRRRR